MSCQGAMRSASMWYVISRFVLMLYFASNNQRRRLCRKVSGPRPYDDGWTTPNSENSWVWIKLAHKCVCIDYGSYKRSITCIHHMV